MKRYLLPLAGCLITSVHAQTPPPDPVPNDPTAFDFGLRWGGETRQIHSRATSSGPQVWTAEDGGRIRHYSNSTGWNFQTTPDDVSQTMLDVWFDSDTHGYACGRAGHLLTTSDGGASWEHFDPQVPELLDSTGVAGAISNLWRTRWVDQDLGFIAGLYTFKRNDNGTARNANDFADVKLWNNLAEVNTSASVGTQDPGKYEFYCLDIVHDAEQPGRWTGFMAGDFWANCNGGHSNFAIGFYTDSALPESDGGRNWWITFRSSDFTGDGPPPFGLRMVDPWDIEFEALSGDPDTMRGYMGGGTSVGDGSLFETYDGGQNWARATFDLTSAPAVPTIYGVSASAGGHGVAAGYAGSIWHRVPDAVDPNVGVWTWSAISGISSPLSAVSATGSRVYLGGSFGVQRASFDGGVTWPVFMNPTYSAANPEGLWRQKSMHFVDESVGWVVGQFQQIAKTTDGGITYTVQHGGHGVGNTLHFGGIDFADAQTGVAISAGDAGGSVPLIRYTADGGATWPAATGNIPAGAKLVDVEYAGGTRFFAVGEDASGDPLVMFTANNGVYWSPILAPPVGVTLTSVAMVGPVDGFIVGYEGANARAYRLDVTVPAWTDVSPVDTPAGEPARRLRAIDARGPVATGEAYAVGDNGSVFRYVHPTGFVDVPALFDIDDVSGALISRATRMDLGSIGMSPQTTILIGMEGFGLDRCSPHWKTDGPLLGRVLRYDGTSWQTDVRCITSKGHRTIQLLNDDAGYLLGAGLGTDVNPEFGEVADSILLRYHTN